MINDEVFTDPLKCKETDQSRLSIPKFVAELDRYKVSDAAGAALATALMEDLELNTHDNTKLVFATVLGDNNIYRHCGQGNRKLNKWYC